MRAWGGGIDEYSLKVSNATETFAFSSVVTVSSRSTWTLSRDISGNDTIASKTAELAVGDNIFYVLVISESNTSRLYTLKVRRRPVYNVIFDANGGTAVTAQHVEEDSLATNPSTTKRGYTFAGWNYDLAQPITGNKIIVAAWTANTYTINYDPKGGDISSRTSDATYDARFTLLTPTRRGYTFEGWTRNGTAFTEGVCDFVTDIYLDAEWSADRYTVSYELNGGTVAGTNPASYTVESETFTLVEPTRGGYRFLGWSGTGISGTVKTVTVLTGSTGNRSYTAEWQPVTYSITYELNGGNNAPSNPGSYTVESSNIYLAAPTRIGYIFNGWFTDAACEADMVTVITSGSYGDVKLYAKWLIEGDYIITYELNGGISHPNPTTYDITSDTITLRAAVRNGYDFEGWYTSPSLTGEKATAIPAGSTGNRTFYAKWSVIDYTISYVTYGGNNDPSNPTGYDVETDDITLRAPTRTSYDFGGWYTDAACETGRVTVIPKGSYGKVTLYAKWTPTEYTITYELNGGTAHSAAAGSYTIESADVALREPTRSGYNFAGWYTSPSLTGEKATAIPAGSTGNKKYYARWGKIGYAIEYVLNGGNNDSSNPTGYDVETDDITLRAPTRTGYDFGGWYTDAACETGRVTVIPKGSYGKVTLYAKWTPTEYTITYELNGGTAHSAAAGSYTIESADVALREPTRSGYNFAGWYTSETGGTKVTAIPAGSTGNKKYYARWTAKTYTVTLDRNGGTGGSDSVTATFDADMPAATAPGDKAGYTFGGYFDIPGTQYYDENMSSVKTWDKLSDATLVAKWINKSYTVCLDGDGGTGGTSSLTATYLKAMPTGMTAATKTGYNFNGYYDGQNGTGTKYYNADMSSARTWNKTSGSTLYAYWTPVSVTVYFSTDGGSGSVPSVTAVYDSAMPEITVKPTKTGFTFAGFADSGNVLYYDAELASVHNWDKTSSATLTAKWTANTYTVLYDGNGGACSLSAQTFTYDVAKALPTAVPTRTGYTFTGWTVNSAGTGTVYNAGQSVSNLTSTAAGSVTLYAKWTPKTSTATLSSYYTDSVSYTVSFDLNGGSGTVPATQTVTDTAGLTYPAIPTRSGYVFAGWYTTSSCTGSPYDFAAKVTANKTLYAKWISYSGTGTITYNSGKSVSVVSKSSSTAYYAFVPLVSCTVTIYSIGSFDSYCYLYNSGKSQLTYNDDGGEGYNFLISYAVTAGTLYYIRPCGYNSSNSALNVYISGSMPASGGTTVGATLVTKKLTYDAPFTLSVPVENGYDFNGWYSGANGTGTRYTDSAGNSVTGWDSEADKTLYPYFTPHLYKISFVTSGGTAINDLEVGYGLTIDYPVPERTGYSLVGWYLDSSGSMLCTYKTMPANDFTLYAKWKRYAVKMTYDTTISVISEFGAMSPTMFNATADDTDGNDVAVVATVVAGTRTAGNTVTVRLRAEGRYSNAIAQVNITNVKVYGSPTISYNTVKGYINMTDTVNSELFSFTGTDTYGAPTATSVTVREAGYRAGDTVTVVLTATDIVGNKTEQELKNIRVFGTPTLNYDTSVTAIKVTDTINDQLFGVTSTDSFGNQIIPIIAVVSGTKAAGNTITVRMTACDAYCNSTYKETTVKVYGTPTITDATVKRFKTTSQIDADSLGVTASDSFGVALSGITAEITSGTQTAGSIVSVTLTVTDILGNVGTRTVTGIRIYGTPTITYNTAKTVIKATDTINATLLGATARNSFNESLTVTAAIKSGSKRGGNSIVVTLTATDVVGNTCTVDTGAIAVYDVNGITLTYDPLLASEIKLTSHGEEFDASATDSFGVPLEITVIATIGTLRGGITTNIALRVTDAAGNVKTSSTISNISIYGIPEIYFDRDFDGNADTMFLRVGEDPSLYFAAKDSFGNIANTTVTVLSGSTDSADTFITVEVYAVDVVFNEITLTYKLPVLNAQSTVVFLNVNGGAAMDDVAAFVPASSVGTALPVPTKEYYDFTGWFDESDVRYSDAAGIMTKNMGNTPTITLYAHWTLHNYSINYELDGGTQNGANATRYNADSPTFTLAAPTKPDHTFLGWYADQAFSGEPLTSVTVGEPYGDKTYYALWEYGTEGLVYTLDAGEYAVTGYTGTATGVVIPLTHLGVPVTSVGNGAFKDNSTLASVVISGNVETIGFMAFYDCTSLADVTLCPGLTTIGRSAFSCCSALTSVDVPDSCTVIAQEAFYRCSGLETAILPDSLTTIEYAAFSDCTSLVNIDIPAGVTSIGGYAFYNCRFTAITVPVGITSIAAQAFGNCTALEYITLPVGITSIATQAFGNCSALERITLPAALTNIDNNAFYNCGALATVIYNGSKTAWAAIVVGDYNDCLTDAEIWYYSPTEPPLANTGNGYGTDKYWYYGPDGVTVTLWVHTHTVARYEDADATGHREICACEYVIDSHAAHVWDSGVVTLAPGCETKGSRLFTCTICGRHRTDEVAPNGHTFTAQKIAQDCLAHAATCDERAVYYYSCAYCDKHSTTLTFEYGEPNGHDFSQIIIDAAHLVSAADCTHKAVYYYDCADCDTMGTTTFEYGEPNGHRFTEQIVDSAHFATAADCTHKARYYYDCADCDVMGTTTFEYGEPNGHRFTEQIADSAHFAEAATCLHKTMYYYDCADCDVMGTTTFEYGDYGPHAFSTAWEFDDDGHWHPATCPHTTERDGYAAHTSNGSGGCTVCSWLFSYKVSFVIDGESWGDTMTVDKTTDYKMIAFPQVDDDSTDASLTRRFFGWYTDEDCSVQAAAGMRLTADTVLYGTIAYYGEEDFVYNIRNNTARITGYRHARPSHLIIPGSLASKPVTICSAVFAGISSLREVICLAGVTAIESSAFMGCDGLTAVTLSAGITTIDERAFRDCTALESITFPAGLTSMGTSAFENCAALTAVALPTGLTALSDSAFKGCAALKTVTFPAGLTTIGYNTFCDCASLESAVLPTSLTSIDNFAFRGCSKLKTVTFPTGLTSIGRYAFNACTSLTSVVLPGTLTSIGEDAFYNCSSLTSVTLNAGITSISENMFSHCAVLAEVELPAGLINIADSAFGWCESLTAIELPDSVTSIGNDAFTYCSQLRSIKLSDSLTSIGDRAFNACTQLESITFPDGLTSIGSRVLYNCKKIKSITLPGSLTSIGEHVFYYTALESVVISEGITSLPAYAFYLCSNLDTIIIPVSCTSIEGSAFNNCSRLSKVYYMGTPAQWSAMSIGSGDTCLTSATRYCYSATAPTALGKYWHYVGGTPEEWVMTDGIFTYKTDTDGVIITDIVGFTGDTLTVPGALGGLAVKRIDVDLAAIVKANGVKTVDIQSELTQIPADMFKDCTTLRTIVLPATLTGILSGAFDGCTELATVYFGSTFAQWGAIAFGSNNGALASATRYYYSEGEPTEAEFAGDHLYWRYVGGTPTPWVMVDGIFKYRINGGNATIVGITGFTGDTLTIPVTVGGLNVTAMTVELGSFIKNNTVKVLDIKAPIMTEMRDNMLRECVSLTTVTLPAGLTSIGNYVFYSCNKLVTVNLPAGVTSIGNYAFYFCAALTAINLPDSLTSIGVSAFQYCGELASIELPAGLTEIGKCAFSRCSSLTTVTVPAGVTAINESLFDGCSSIAYVVLPAGLTTVAKGGFNSCTSLNTVYFMGTAVQWTAVTVRTYNDKLTSAARYHYSAATPTAPGKYWHYVDGTPEEWVMTDGIYKYRFADDGAHIIDLVGFTGTSLTIPATLGGIAVKGTDFDFVSFIKDRNIKDLDIGAIAIMGDDNGKFKNCTSLESVSLPAGLTAVAEQTFYSCTSLKTVTLPSTLTSIGRSAFNRCSALISVNVPAGCTLIDQYAFFNCSALTGVMLPDGLTSIGYSAFSGCASLENINWPSTLTSLGDFAFYNCKFTEVALPSGITSIGTQTFCNCKSLVTVVLPGSLTSIGEKAFFGCSSLESVVIPYGVTTIGLNAFFGCTELTCVTLPASLTTICNYAFNKTDGYDTVYFMGTIAQWSNVSVGTYNTGLTAAAHFYFHDGIYRYVADGSNVIIVDIVGFAGDSLSFPAMLSGRTVSSVDMDLVGIVNAYGIKNIDLSTLTITTMPDSMFEGCTTLTTIVFPTGLTTIGKRVFFGCSSLTDVTVPDTVTSIQNSAFNRCSSLKTFTVPDGCTSIAPYAFYFCTELESIILPAGIKTIGGYAFNGCSSLSAVYFKGTAAQWAAVTINAGNGKLTEENCYIYSKNKPDDAELQGENVYWRNVSGKPTPWVRRSGIYKYTITSGKATIINLIGFDGTSLTIPAEINGVPVKAVTADLESIAKANSITTVVIQAALTTTPTRMFADCTTLQSVTFAAGTESIDNFAFYGCTALTSVTFPAGLTSIGTRAFSGCKALTAVTLPAGLLSIGSDAFAWCDRLATVTLPEGLTTIEYAFFGCKALTSIIIPDSITSIGRSAFNNCSALKTVVLPAGLTSIDDCAFYRCPIETVYFKGSAEQWAAVTIGSEHTYALSAEKIYCYSEETPVSSGNYWHYVNGTMTKW